jgi:formylglycine-generating enzyme required for sulfatase activity
LPGFARFGIIRRVSPVSAVSEPAPLKYRAFISYSHADTGWARWLHRGLESFAIDKDLVGRETATGTIPGALRPIFRDREDFSAGKALTEQTLAALTASAALVVICSPSAAKSRYVDEEIRLFKARYPSRPAIPLIVAGRRGDAKTECFPPALRFKLDAAGQVTAVPEELIAADAQEEADGKALALAKVVAGLLGLSSDEVFRRADRERRAALRRRRRIQGLFALLLLLLSLGGLLWLKGPYLWDQYHWLTAMGARVLTPAEERALEPGSEFAECSGGCPTMVVLPAGKYQMGSPDGVGLDTEHPQHEVTVAAFAIGKHEVTMQEWDACVAAGVCPATSDTGWGRAARPAINLSWEDAQLYVDWLSRHTGKTYRLPSESEWEYAARGGTTTLYSFGEDAAGLADHAWYKDNSEHTTHPVGGKKPNGFGLHDVHGNVWEWVEDRSHPSYAGAPSDGSAWTEGVTSDRMMRGGDFFFEPSFLRSGQRYMLPSNFRNYSVGFRVARDLDQ